uniref:Uncharacterized protein n=1 Tax=Anguilla anguilla TaxID=7936 RepID=A0A0E9RFV8_ANGAN
MLTFIIENESFEAVYSARTIVSCIRFSSNSEKRV